MKFDIDFILAETHTPDYLMHKYWARKPHNVINQCISILTPENGVVVDPFCGSGVTLREGSRLGRNCYGFDLNPSAILISKVLNNPPSKEEFIKVFTSIYENLHKKYGHLYMTKGNEVIKYISHKIITKCSCGMIVKQGEATKNGKKYLCPHCGLQLRFNLESLNDTEVFAITVDKNKGYIPSNEEIVRQKELSEFEDCSVKTEVYNYKFPENRRILAFDGITTSSFFTKRNFTILCAFANEIWNIKNDKIKDCCLLLLNASVAQCSRLIAHRNNLSTGGPAWSVPGFWIPQEHLETNPFVHIKARMNKFLKAIEYIKDNPALTEPTLIQGDSLSLIENTDIKADLIFLDPPYGDSVPYTEFSNIWNSFLKNIPSSDLDISVSDRIDKNESWNRYSIKLHEYMKCFTNHLTENGKLLITFNNNDMKAWISLISALQDNNFVCKSVFYQIPAVISSKAQMSIDSSYISDVYSVYVYDNANGPTTDTSRLVEHLKFVANSRGGTVSKIVLDREFIITWLKENISHELLANKETIIKGLFSYDKKTNCYSLKEEYITEAENLKDHVLNCVKKLINNGPMDILNCYRFVCRDSENFGTMELSEFKDIIKEYILDDGRKVGVKQLTLFDLI